MENFKILLILSATVIAAGCKDSQVNREMNENGENQKVDLENVKNYTFETGSATSASAARDVLSQRFSESEIRAHVVHGR